MTQISIDASLAYMVASAIKNVSDQLDNARSGLSSQWFYLGESWEGASRDPVEASVQGALGNLSQAGEQTYSLGATLEAIAQRFEAADENTQTAVASITWETLRKLPESGMPSVLGVQTEVSPANQNSQPRSVADYDALIVDYQAQLANKKDRLDRVVPTALAGFQTSLAGDEKLLAEVENELSGANYWKNWLMGTLGTYETIRSETLARMQTTKERITALEEEQRRLPAEIKALEADIQTFQQARQIELVKATVPLSQHDPQWRDETMGPNGTIGRYGCFITTLAMICRTNGVDMDPQKVNEWMKQHGGYQPSTSSMYVAKEEQFLQEMLNKPELKRHNISANVDSLKSQLQKGQPVVVHLPTNDADGHWVLATGVDSQGHVTYIDSGTGQQKTFKPQTSLLGAYVFE